MKVRVNIGVRNGEIVTRREALGLMTGAELSRASGIHQYEISKIERLGYRPRDTRPGRHNRWRPAALKLAAFFRCLPEDLWPEEYSPQDVRTVSLDAEVADIGHMVEQLTPHALLEQRQEHAELHRLLEELPERTRRGIEMRQDGATYKQIGEGIGVGVERARQIEQRAMRALRYRAMHGGGSLAERGGR